MNGTQLLLGNKALHFSTGLTLLFEGDPVSWEEERERETDRERWCCTFFLGAGGGKVFIFYFDRRPVALHPAEEGASGSRTESGRTGRDVCLHRETSCKTHTPDTNRQIPPLQFISSAEAFKPLFLGGKTFGRSSLIIPTWVGRSPGEIQFSSVSASQPFDLLLVIFNTRRFPSPLCSTHFAKNT